MEPFVRSLTTHVDDRGDLTELVRDDWENFGKIRQVYMVRNHGRGIIRGFHCHRELIDYFTIIKGAAKFVLFDWKHEPQTLVESQSFVLTEKKLQTLVVPVMWMHGYVSLTDDTILLSTASQTYNQENPDEIRIPWDYIGEDVFEVNFK